MSARRWLTTIRFRLTVSYSAWVFVLGALVITSIYLGVLYTLETAPPVEQERLKVFIHDVGGGATSWTVEKQNAVESFERKIQYQAIALLGRYSAIALSALFLLSLLIGWWQAGRALRPIRRITQRAREIGATDLSRRIALDGPPDELRGLADTIDDMLARLDTAFADQRRLLGDASHELRNPLAIIQANVDAVLTRPDATVSERDQAGEVVRRAVLRMSGLVEDLLATGRRDAPAFAETESDLAALAEESAAEHDQLATEAGLALTRELTPGLRVIGDRDALKRATANLLSNALRFAPAGSAVRLATGRGDGWCWIAVHDEGPGIRPDDQPRVFDRFWQAGEHAAHNGHSGLGLAIVRQIMEGHDGRVTVHSVPGQGCTFVLWLPDQAAPHRTASPQPAGQG
ncbi:MULTISPECIES: HAMP domain-containing sensor histidine kinase [unclassified Crossiella]|uniref:sensor histidine kinase n=1 Tax=unclassified Crossiella TaxID=2620835 RepID=UPI0020001E1F|nr:MULTISPECIES: HAMP domain-containing sensor histidine kinase [unclassified Crossiella]MCK2243955.1 HAMP domain-containing histidine kinase [Crossiella sp. S99.2]MCK2257187.1 HAMP domain-containing histidine kinase [Crossiella sp. S99.1]